MDRQAKLQRLKEYFAKLDNVAIAYSGGVDSTFLLKVAFDTLSERAVAITVDSSFFPKREKDETIDFCTENNIRHIKETVDVLNVTGVKDNPADRCYLCKKALFGRMLKICQNEGITTLAEGSNLDDEGDYRPGLKAISELGIKSPLRECSFTKEDIRALSRELDLKTYDKPSYACLASRVPYGSTITEDKLAMIEKSEMLLSDMGFRQMRVRHHDDIARIELLVEDFDRFMEDTVRMKVYRELMAIGFKYVTLDIRGFRTGSMNEVLQWKKEK